jgi:iron complex outermembrane receptor protein
MPIRPPPAANRSAALPAAAVLCLALAAPAAASTEDFSKMSLEQLLQVEVTTPTKAPQPLVATAAAAFVITAADIQRSGATNIPELLRTVPGVSVAQLNASTFAITVRGFNGVYANKLLVLIDGRSVYTPLFSGVQWDLVDVPLEDIDRIEVIRGPGGTLWGANAFNGVINIITKTAQQTAGALLAGRAGNEEAGALARLGGIDGATAWRLWGKFDHHADEPAAAGGSAADGYDFGRAGFRIDTAPQPDLQIMVEGGATHGGEGAILQRLTPAFPFAPFLQRSVTDVSQAFVLGRVNKALGGDQDWQLQSYLDWTDRGLAILRERRLTADVEFQHRSMPFAGHQVIWGLGYRATTDSTQGTFDLALVPPGLTEQLANFFVQDEIALVPKRLTLTLGSKFEYNTYTAFDVQPNIRLLWQPGPQQALWGAISRAVRTPSRAERNLLFNDAVLAPPLTPFPTLVTVFGNPRMVNEKVIAFETGYRAQPVREVALDLAAFYNIYTDLGTFDAGPPTLLGFVPTIPVTVGNNARGHAYGVELAGDWQPTPWLRLRNGWDYQLTKLTRADDSTDTTSIAYQNSTPRHQLFARASAALSPTVSFDLAARYVGKLKLAEADTAILTLPNVNSYWALDARLGWRATDRLLLELIGQNLNRDRHIEFQDFGPTRAATAEIGRSVFARATVRF